MISDSIANMVHDPLRRDLDHLRERWESFDVVEQHHQISESEHDPGEEPDDGIFRYAAAWIRHESKVLLVQPTVDTGWTEPGGTHEFGETFEETARREVYEETGIKCRLTGILEAIVTIIEPGNLEPINALGVIFTAEYVNGEIRPEPEEIDDVRWFSELPDEDRLVFPRITEYPL